MQIPAIDLHTAEKLETATFAMGCFWSPDAIFGSQEGVVRTRVGYAGGSTENPTYKQMADHIETLQLDFDPAKISYSNLLDLFFSSHTPIREPWKRQYSSALFYHTEEQERLIYLKKQELEEKLGKKIFTEINPYHAFYLAEERHQKYKLQRQPLLLAEFRSMYPHFSDFVDSTAAARVNGYLYGCGSGESLDVALTGLGLSPEGQNVLMAAVTKATGAACS